MESEDALVYYLKLKGEAPYDMHVGEYLDKLVKKKVNSELVVHAPMYAEYCMKSNANYFRENGIPHPVFSQLIS